jgi:serine/threonine protein phosphatase PrpC
VGKDLGIVHSCDIFEIKLVNKEHMIVLGSDGLFEFLNNEDVNR